MLLLAVRPQSGFVGGCSCGQTTSLPSTGRENPPPPLSHFPSMSVPRARCRRWRTQFANYEYISPNSTPLVCIPSFSVSDPVRTLEIALSKTARQRRNTGPTIRIATGTARPYLEPNQAGFESSTSFRPWTAIQELRAQRGKLSATEPLRIHPRTLGRRMTLYPRKTVRKRRRHSEGRLMV